VDYEKAKQDALGEKESLTKRREEIDQETARLKHERAVTERRLVGLKQVLDGLTIMTTEPAPPPATPEPVVVTPPTFIQEPPPRKTLPFPISLVVGLVVRKERKHGPAPQLRPTAGNGAIVVKTEWEGTPPPLPRVEPRQEKREWLG
jgi:hypothetical protein